MTDTDFFEQFHIDTDPDRNPDPYLVHTPCGELLCNVEHDDTLGVLMSVASDHQCAETTHVAPVRFAVWDNVYETKVGQDTTDYGAATRKCSGLNTAAGPGGRYGVRYASGVRIPWEVESKLLGLDA